MQCLYMLRWRLLQGQCPIMYNAIHLRHANHFMPELNETIEGIATWSTEQNSSQPARVNNIYSPENAKTTI